MALANSLFAVVMHLLVRVSQKASNFTLRYMKAIPSFYPTHIPNDMSQTPVDLRTALKLFNLEAKFTVYICCPKCYFLYHETEEIPLFCTKEDLGISCGAKLTKLHGGRLRPACTFLYQSPIDWLARLFQRPNIEKIVDSPKNFNRPEGNHMKG